MAGNVSARALHLHRLIESATSAGGQAGGPAAWRRRAACKGIDPAVFHPDDGDDAAAEAAREVCSACPVRQACLEHALAVREPDGVWGGLTARERRRELRRRRRSA